MTAHRDSPEPVHEDEIDDKFKPATSIYPCPSCGEECEIEHSISEFAEFIYCENCRTKFTRDRDTFVKHDYASDAKTIIKKSRQDKEDYVRFKCYRCNTVGINRDYRIHEKTVVGEDRQFERIETGLVGYDECSLVCPCGERHYGYLDINVVVECECGRVFQLLQNSGD